MDASRTSVGKLRCAAALLAAVSGLASSPGHGQTSAGPPSAPVSALVYPAEPVSAFTAARLRFGGDDARTRIVLEVDRPLSSKVEAGGGGEAPARLVLRLSALSDASPSSGPGLGLIKAWTLTPDGAGARLTLDLRKPGVVAHRYLLDPRSAGGPYRYVVDVTRAPEVGTLGAEVSASPIASPIPAPAPAPTRLASFAASRAGDPPATSLDGASLPLRPTAKAAHSGHAGARATAAQSVPTPPVRHVVVIDAGHGGHDPGAQSSGANEKDINLASALALRVRLERTGRYKVVMTRDSDVFIPLEERVRIARRAGAELFISLHADSAGADPETHGASVYTLSNHGESRVTQVLGPHEWFSGAARQAADPGVGQILLDLTQRSTLDRSGLFAGILVDHVRGEADLLPRSHRDASYFVLLAPDVPAALLEMGFISSPLDQARLTDPARRDRLMDAVAAAIEAYFLGGPGAASRS